MCHRMGTHFYKAIVHQLKQFIRRKFTYNLKLNNIGDASATNTVLEDTIPSGATFISASEAGQYTEAERKVVWNFGDLAPNTLREVSVTVQAAKIGVLRSTARATAVCAELVSAVAVTEITGISAVLLEVSDNPDPIEVGNQVTYTIIVTSQGTAAVTNIRIVCSLEKQMAYVSSSGTTQGTLQGQTLTFAPVASLAPNAKASWSVFVKATASGDIRFKVSMTTDQLTRTVEETEATNFYE